MVRQIARCLAGKIDNKNDDKIGSKIGKKIGMVGKQVTRKDKNAINAKNCE